MGFSWWTNFRLTGINMSQLCRKSFQRLDCSSCFLILMFVLLQRLLPVDAGTDLFVYKVPEEPSCKMYDVRPGNLLTDQHHIRSVCRSAYSSAPCDENLFPDLINDR